MAPPSPRESARPTPDPSTPPDPQPAARSPLFAEPTPEPEPDLTTAQEGPSDHPAFESGYGPADAMPDAPRSSSAPPSTIDRKGVQAAIEAGVHLVTNEVNRSLVRDELEREDGLFVADEHEAKQLALPLSKIAVRHAPDGMGANPDLTDLITALLVIAGYLSRNLGRRRELKRAKAEGRIYVDPQRGVQIIPAQPAPEQAAEPAA